MAEAEMETFRERTLANRYQPRQHLPPNFSHVLKTYAREVLRAQPEDVLQWSAAYFRRLALETDPLQARQPPPGHYAPDVADAGAEVLTQRMTRVFAEMDAPRRATLPPAALRQALLESFGLTPSQALYIMTGAAVPLGEGDAVDYHAFARESVRAVQFFQQTRHEFAVGDIEDATVHGLSRRDVQQEFLRLLRFVDEAGTGMLLFEQYRQALVNAPFHLTHRDISILCIEAVRNERNEVDYESEIAYMFDRLLLAEQFQIFDDDL